MQVSRSFGTIRPGIIGIFCVLGAALSFSTVDMLIKTMSDTYSLHQIVMVRSIVATMVILAIFVPLEGGYRQLKSKRLPMHLLRGFCVVIANLSFFTGIASLPLADASAIFFVAPLLITAMSVPFLGERVGIRRWAAVTAGLIGVVVMIRPGSDSFQIAALAPILAAVAYASMQILTRKLGGTENASTMAFYIQFTFLLVSGTVGLSVGDGRYAEGLDNPSLQFLLRAWAVPTTVDLAIMIGLGLLSACGAYLISQGYRLVEAASAAPFEYISLVMAVFWGIVIWGDWPDLTSIIGISMIVGGGLYTLWRENVRGKPVAAESPMPKNR